MSFCRRKAKFGQQGSSELVITLFFMKLCISIWETLHRYVSFNDPPEIFRIKERAALNPLDSVHNAQDYRFYVGCGRPGSHNSRSRFQSIEWLSKNLQSVHPDPDRPSFLPGQDNATLPATPLALLQRCSHLSLLQSKSFLPWRHFLA